MRLTGSRAYYRTTPPKMPSGLVELIEGLTREVLKNNPSDIHGFCAGHMQQLLEIRDGPKKALTLEEKIAKAQKKIRQRAEQRRKQYNNDLLNQQSSTVPETKASIINKDDTPRNLPQDPAAVHALKQPNQNEQVLDSKSEAESSPKLYTPSEGSQYQENKEANDRNDLKEDTKSELKETKCVSQSETNFAELSNATGDSIISQNPTLIEPAKADALASKVDMLDHFRAPSADGQTSPAGQSFKEDHQVVADNGGSHELTEVLPSPELKLSSPINSVIKNDNSGLADADEKVSMLQLENTTDLVVQDSLTKEVNIISSDIAETQTANITLPLNTEENQNPNDAGRIQNVTNPDIINQSNIDNVEPTTISDDIDVNRNEEDPQDTNTIAISFKESPIVDLQDPQINSDMLESLLETNTNSNIVTLLTQDSAEFNSTLTEFQENAFNHTTANAETSDGNCEAKETNSVREEYEENTQHKNVMNSTELENKENNTIDKNGDQNTSTKLSEPPHNQDGNMDLETAAVTIQKVFRSFLFKSRASTFDDAENDETVFLNEAEKNKEECSFPITGCLNDRRPHGLTRMDTVLQTVNEEKSLSLSTDDSSTMSSAATVIQAHVRGFLVRNKLHSNKTASTNSLVATHSNEPSLTSLEIENEQNKNKTVLNIHIVPEGGNYLSRDESLITSMDLSLDSSPPSSINLQIHPLGYDKSERRKQLKREDAIQSISPPSNNSGKLSEDVDSVKELTLNENEIIEEHQADNNVQKDDLNEGASVEGAKKESNAEKHALDTVISYNAENVLKQPDVVEKLNSDEMDVVTPFISNEDTKSSDLNLMHSGEFHDAVLPTKVSRSDTTVASEFKNVLVYFLLWNHS